MHIMNMFCPIIKSSKSRKSHPPSTTRNNCSGDVIGKGTAGGGGGGGQNNNISNNSTNNINNNNINNNNNNSQSNNNNNTNCNSNSNSVHHNNINNHIDNQLIATSNPCRYVIDHYSAVEEDELSVSPGDIVFLKSTDRDSTGRDWSYVVSLDSFLKGYVPSSILSIEPPKRNHIVEPKKKLPRSIINHHNITPNQHHLHNSHNHHNFSSHRTQQHTLQNHLQQNLIDAQNHHNIPYETSKFTLFSRENFGLFMVTNNFIAREENDLSVRPGDYITVLNKDDDDWYWVRRCDDSKEGFVPSKFICDYEQVKAFLNKGNSTVTMKSSNQNDVHTYINHKIPDKESLNTDQQSSVFHHS